MDCVASVRNNIDYILLNFLYSLIILSQYLMMFVTYVFQNSKHVHDFKLVLPFTFHRVELFESKSLHIRLCISCLIFENLGSRSGDYEEYSLLGCAPWSLIDHSSILKLEVAGSSETLVTIYQADEHHIPENNNIVTRRAVTMQRPRDKKIYQNRF
jgi:hypothetical protein